MVSALHENKFSRFGLTSLTLEPLDSRTPENRSNDRPINFVASLCASCDISSYNLWIANLNFQLPVWSYSIASFTTSPVG